MLNSETRSPSLARHHLEELWRQRLEMARERYEMATARCREILEQRHEGILPPSDDRIVLARNAESKALAEYTRILRIFIDFTVRGRIPEEEVAAGAGRPQND